MIQKSASPLIMVIILMIALQVLSHAKLVALSVLMELYVPFVIMDGLWILPPVHNVLIKIVPFVLLELLQLVLLALIDTN